MELGRAQPGSLPEDEPVPAPEDYVGRTIERGDGARRIDSINAIGSKFVVFDLRNLASGEIEEVLKVPRSAFDPMRPLIAAFPEATRNAERNPDRIIRICNKLLELDPSQEAAAFTKGVAHLMKQEIPEALEGFDLAVSISPHDALNLIHRASCFAMLDKDHECLRDISVAAAHSSRDLSVGLVHVSGHAATIRQSLRRSERAQRSNPRARQLLREYWGLSLRLRAGTHALRQKLFPSSQP